MVEETYKTTYVPVGFWQCPRCGALVGYDQMHTCDPLTGSWNINGNYGNLTVQERIAKALERIADALEKSHD